jgi:hypothetical protein
VIAELVAPALHETRAAGRLGDSSRAARLGWKIALRANRLAMK